jgi:hypothetical protein
MAHEREGLAFARVFFELSTALMGPKPTFSSRLQVAAFENKFVTLLAARHIDER